MDSAEANSTNEHKKTALEAAINEDAVQDVTTTYGNNPQLDKRISKSSSTSSSSTSQSSSSEDDGDFFQLELGKPMPGDHALLLQQDCNLVTPGPTQSPPPQTMSRTDGPPDPNRIPSSVFTRTKSTTPMEWSVASNESLFSIHLGNNSFSRDHVLLLKSGDLTNFYVGNLDSSSPFSTPVGMDSSHALEQHENVAQAANAEAMKDVLRAAADEHSSTGKPPVELPPLGNSLSRNSDSSVQSFRSFAFPILTGEGRNASMKAVETEQPEKQTTGTPKGATSAATAPPPVSPATQSKWFTDDLRTWI
ncbi:hypothetical protein J5N97_020462 [Dioscorea zingiberensis]|uniref:Uncharacterized protein n=1 Tax=Dioscorea zingiberensis TaxID=325984 RepID=A0A9D5CH55_9LILI|nr:hypothetical protein J5N97_020462 [Dioscorea zingiberensis]